jgi:hypothetical protein
MPTIRRIVFGEPKPGEAQFAGLLSKLDESVSYCNRTGPLAHDRVTDLPFAIPALKLNFVHPTTLAFVSAAPADNDPLGIFAYHHMTLYDEGAEVLPAQHRHAADLCRAIYAYPSDPPFTWDERLDTAGVAWGVSFGGPVNSTKTVAYVVFRGSYTLLDWLRDLVGFAPAVSHPMFGPMWGGFLIGMEETWAAIKPLLKGMDEIVFTGHSLGASRADVAAGYMLMDGSNGP